MCMIRGFWKSRLVFSGICVLTLVLAVALWVRDRNYEIYIPIVASVLMLGIGYSAAVLAGNLVANQENTKYLGTITILYNVTFTNSNNVSIIHNDI